MATYGSKSKWQESQLRKYNIKTEPIDRISINDAAADKYVSDGVCKIIMICMNFQ